MAGTIGSVVNRARMPTLLRTHAIGLALGAVTMALVLSLLGAVTQPALREFGTPLAIIAGVVLAGWALRIVVPWGLPFPQRSWQVPEHWRYSLPPTVTLGTYGYLLGLGGLTYMVVPTYWLLAAGTVAVTSLPVALCAWIGFALVRFLTTWRGARIVTTASDGSEDVTPHGLLMTRTAAAGLLAATAIASVTWAVTI
jgi:hypothetical protein